VNVGFLGQDVTGSAPSACVESARLTPSTALEPAYVRTGRVWQARRAEDGAIRWEQWSLSPAVGRVREQLTGYRRPGPVRNE
jgi:hypothetical protein